METLVQVCREYLKFDFCIVKATDAFVAKFISERTLGKIKIVLIISDFKLTEVNGVDFFYKLDR